MGPVVAWVAFVAGGSYRRKIGSSSAVVDVVGSCCYYRIAANSGLPWVAVAVVAWVHHPAFDCIHHAAGSFAAAGRPSYFAVGGLRPSDFAAAACCIAAVAAAGSSFDFPACRCRHTADLTDSGTLAADFAAAAAASCFDSFDCCTYYFAAAVGRSHSRDSVAAAAAAYSAAAAGRTAADSGCTACLNLVVAVAETKVGSSVSSSDR